MSKKRFVLTLRGSVLGSGAFEIDQTNQKFAVVGEMHKVKIGFESSVAGREGVVDGWKGKGSRVVLVPTSRSIPEWKPVAERVL